MTLGAVTWKSLDWADLLTQQPLWARVPSLAHLELWCPSLGRLQLHSSTPQGNMETHAAQPVSLDGRQGHNCTPELIGQKSSQGLEGTRTPEPHSTVQEEEKCISPRLSKLQTLQLKRKLSQDRGGSKVRPLSTHCTDSETEAVQFKSHTQWGITGWPGTGASWFMAKYWSKNLEEWVEIPLGWNREFCVVACLFLFVLFFLI